MKYKWVEIKCKSYWILKGIEKNKDYNEYYVEYNNNEVAQLRENRKNPTKY